MVVPKVCVVYDFQKAAYHSFYTNISLFSLHNRPAQRKKDLLRLPRRLKDTIKCRRKYAPLLYPIIIIILYYTHSHIHISSRQHSPTYRENLTLEKTSVADWTTKIEGPTVIHCFYIPFVPCNIFRSSRTMMMINAAISTISTFLRFVNSPQR